MTETIEHKNLEHSILSVLGDFKTGRIDFKQALEEIKQIFAFFRGLEQ